MKVAVTGASGFIGRHVIAALGDRSVSVTGVLRPGKAVPEWLTGHDVVHVDIASPPPNPFITLGRPDVVIHLAWGGLPNYRAQHHVDGELPLHYKFLRGLIEDGLTALLVSGTCFEYGMQSGALAEDLEPHPANPYGVAKDALRRQLEALADERPFALTWARLFYLFGEGQATGSLRAQLERAVRAGSTSFDMSGGEQIRDYLPVRQAAEYLVTLALSSISHGIVNVCSGHPVSVRALVARWVEENGWTIAPNLGKYAYPDYEPMSFWGDARKLQQCVGAA